MNQGPEKKIESDLPLLSKEEELKNKYNLEVVDDPDSPSLVAFRDFLLTAFKPEEIEPLAVFRNELASNNNPETKARYACLILREIHTNEVASVAYGSVQSGVVAIRFTLTESSRRSTGLSQHIDQAFLNDAKQSSKSQGAPVWSCLCEAVERSEHYWNKLEIEPGNGMRRAYIPGTNQEVYYRLPWLQWEKNGDPVTDDGVVTEHLQVALTGYQKEIPTIELVKALRIWWEQWYIRPESWFENIEAWEKHRNTVMNILEKEIIQPLNQYETLDLVSKEERGKN